jgi:predicted Zn-dependent protease with MMP-like domain
MARPPRPTLGAVAIAASVAGVVLLLLEPPSLAVSRGLIGVVVGAVAVVLVGAWITATLLRRDGVSEPEFERVVERTERLAHDPEVPEPEPESEFDELVADAIDRLPPEFQRVLEEVPVVISHRGAREAAYGHYYGDTIARDDFEDRIVLYRDTLERDFGHDRELLEDEIERTLRHELAHHLGWWERGVQDLGL